MSIEFAERITAIEARLQELKSIGTPGNYASGNVLYGGTDGKIASDTNLKWDSVNTKLTINGGNTSGFVVLTIDEKVTADTVANAARYGNVVEYIANPGATQLTATKYNTFLWSAVDGSGGASGLGNLIPLRVDYRFRQTAGTFSGVLLGVDSILTHSGAGALSNAYGFRAVPLMSSTGAVTNYIGYLSEAPNISSSGGITNFYGFRASALAVAGVGNAWAFYQSGASDSNYFNGPSGFGTTSPATRLDIVGTVSSYSAGPHIDFTTSADAHRAMQILPYAHDNINLTFDAWFNGSNWVSGDTGSNYQIRKSGDTLQFFRSTGITAGTTIASWLLDLSIASDGFVQFGVNAVRQTAKLFTIANAGVAALGMANLGFALIQNGGGAAMYIINGGGHTTQEVFDPAGIYSPTAGTATSINIYWSAGNSRYEIQNNRGSTQNVRVWLFDAP